SIAICLIYTLSLHDALPILVESVIIVVLLLIFFMGFRSGVIIGLNLVVIVIGSLLILNMAGGTLQRVSLGSFILAMGMLVDNAIDRKSTRLNSSHVKISYAV